MTDARINREGVAVDPGYYFQTMATCPANTKVQLLGPGNVAVYGKWNGRDAYWKGWAPCPKIPEHMK